MINKYNKKLLILLSAVLFVLGFLLGFLAIRQILESQNQYSLPIQIAFYAASGLVPGVVLLLSSKAVYLFLRALNQRLKKGFMSLGSSEIAALIFGVLIGVMIAFLCDVLLSLFLKIDALRILFDVLVGFASAYLAVYLCLGWLSRPGSEAEEIAAAAPVAAATSNGYLLAHKALENPKIIPLLTSWLSGEKYVLSTSADGLIDSLDPIILENYRILSESGALKIIISDPLIAECEAMKKYSEKNGLKIILAGKDDAKDYAECKNILFLDEL